MHSLSGMDMMRFMIILELLHIINDFPASNRTPQNP